MAAGVLPVPGDEFGPCRQECTHRDCAATREMAATVCGLCPEPIGYDTRFYRDAANRLVHAACLEARFDG